MVSENPRRGESRATEARGASRTLRAPIIWLLSCACIFTPLARGQEPAPDWQARVRRRAEAQDWVGALRIVDQEIAHAPRDMDVRAWRARVLTWSGRLAEAEQEYVEILKAAPSDPDNWMGLANVYSRQGRNEDALQALNRAIELAPNRADLRAARGRALRALGSPKDARLEFQRALDLDPGSAEARAGLLSLRPEPRHELRFGQDNDVFNFADANHDGGMSLTSRWSQHWSTSAGGSYYRRGGVDAGKFVGSATARQPHWGALTLGGATAHDNAVIPKAEAFFDYDHGWKVSEAKLLRGAEFSYGQHWYWYSSARILALNGMTALYLPREWSWSIGFTESRSHFSSTGAEWRPSGTTRLAFPISNWGQRQLGGNIYFAVGTENFAQVDQIGQFSSQTYGGGLRFQLDARQAITGFAAYQKRTQDRTDTSFGFTYAFRF